jgi:hypothetical protein
MRWMGMKIVLVAVLGGALFGAPAADARDWRQGPGPRMQQGQNQPVKKAPPQQGKRDGDKQAEHGKRHSNRLTDQERRDLRRDVDRADREIYRR